MLPEPSVGPVRCQREARACAGRSTSFEQSNEPACHLPSVGGTEFGYVYDFSDNWKRQIIVEQIGNPESSAKYPRFLVVNVDAHLKTAAVRLATLISSKTSPWAR
jgi:hypothetical protein